MASIHVTFPITSSLDDAWAAFCDFGNVHERVARGFVVDTEPDGAERVVTFVNGEVARERLISVEHDRHRLVYGVVDSSLGLTHHQAAVELADVGDHITFTWTADVLPNDVAPAVEAMMQAGADAIGRTLSGTV